MLPAASWPEDTLHSTLNDSKICALSDGEQLKVGWKIHRPPFANIPGIVRAGFDRLVAALATATSQSGCRCRSLFNDGRKSFSIVQCLGVGYGPMNDLEYTGFWCKVLCERYMWAINKGDLIVCCARKEQHPIYGCFVNCLVNIFNNAWSLSFSSCDIIVFVAFVVWWTSKHESASKLNRSPHFVSIISFLFFLNPFYYSVN